jgi:hypothetical protein
MSIEFHDPTNRQPVTELWAYLSVDENGNEGLCAVPMPGFGTVQLVFGYERTAMTVGMQLAQQMAGMTKKKIRLVKFTNREVVRTL